MISAWSVTTVRTEHVEPVSQPPHREVKACLMGRIASSRLVNMLVCLTMKLCISTLVITYGERSRSHLGPSKGLADFLDWATGNYEVDGASHDVIPRVLPLEVASSHGHVMRSVQGLGGKNPQIPHLPWGKCTRFTGLGSNAYIQIKTCLDCGHSTRTKRVDVFPENPEACKHQNMEHRGSK